MFKTLPVVILLALGFGSTNAQGPCDSNPCKNDGNCRDNPSQFTCTCKGGLAGDTCEEELDECESSPCKHGAVCADEFNAYKCECPAAWTGPDCDIEVTPCTSEPCQNGGTCTVTSGTYHCQCRLGYNDDNCERNIMKHCDDVKTELNRKSLPVVNDFYYVDPDGSYPVPEMKVYCVLEGDMYGHPTPVTEVEHDFDSQKVSGGKPFSWSQEVKYKNDITIAQMKALMQNSKYCEQQMTFDCKGVNILEDGKWKGGDDEWHRLIDSGAEEGKCGCSILGACEGISKKCNCDDAAKERLDQGKIRNKALLPITEFALGGVRGADKLKVWLSPLRCGEKHFNYPQDCKQFKGVFTEAKNDVILIDLDGPDGSDDPFYVRCDMESYNYVQITQVPHKTGVNGLVGLNLFNEVGSRSTVNIEYSLSAGIISKLKDFFPHCYQDIGYKCTNSGLLGGDGGYWTSLDGTRRNYWGSSDEDNKCACGIIGMCEDRSAMCNCNIMDGQTRHDFGVITNKDHLPVGSMSFKLGNRGASGAYYVGWLGCASRTFGFEPSCQWYRYSTRASDKSAVLLYSYTFLIDPDGPLTEAPSKDEKRNDVKAFPVHCEFGSVGSLLGVSTVPATIGELSGDERPVTYAGLNEKILTALISRSVYCTQQITYNCNRSPIHRDSQNVVWWYNMEEEIRDYFHGTHGTACECNGRCEGSNDKCNCDVNTDDDLQDIGLLSNKSDLPVWKLHPEDGGYFDLGPLQCYEVYETCAKFVNKYEPLVNQNRTIENGRYCIDPDGPGGVDPFSVYCRSLETVVSVTGNAAFDIQSKKEKNPENKAGPFKTCKKINYGVSVDKLRALSKVSPYCWQYAIFECQRAPFTTHSKWKNREGLDMTGWAGNLGGEECQCGEVNRCAGGVDALCHCNMNDGSVRVDKGLLIDKEQLPISEICTGYDENQPGTNRSVSFKVHEFVCSPGQKNMEKNCEMLRMKGAEETLTQVIDSDDSGGQYPAIAYCEMTIDPPVGVTNFIPENEACLDSSGFTDISYLRVDTDQIQGFLNHEQYCHQDLFFTCPSGASSISLSSLAGWVDYQGNTVAWADTDIDERECPGGTCACNAEGIARIRIWENSNVDGQSRTLPVSKIKKGSAQCVRVGPLSCYDIYKHCMGVYEAGYNRFNPVTGRIYPIDPDQANGEPLFRVQCNFNLISDGGVTILSHSVGKTQVTETKTDYDLDYDANVVQLQRLVEVSHYCNQLVDYQCYGVPLLNDFSPAYAQLKDRDGNLMKEFWGSDKESIANEGCACMEKSSCPDNPSGGKYMCRCDSLKDWREWGKLINKDLLPLKGFVLGGGPIKKGKEAFLTVGQFECSPHFFGFEWQDCSDVKKEKLPSGEYYVRSATDVLVGPTLVFCDFSVPQTNDYDDCDSRPCLNGGYCQDGQDRYSCICPEGYIGDRCDTDFDECSSSPCQHGATCVDVYLAYTCHCVQGYEGDLCEANVDDCVDEPCLNGGNCIDGFNTFTCDCIAGFEGDECQLNLDGCINLPCENGAKCEEFVDVFECVCLPGFTDRLCTTNIDECESAPCLHDGVCLNLNGSFECICPSGYYGTRCDDDVNECASAPCQNNGTCTDRTNGFQCTCEPSYGGPACNREANKCESLPCQHGGWCLDRLAGYDCECNHTAYYGRLCTIPKTLTPGGGWLWGTTPGTTTLQGWISRDAAAQKIRTAVPQNIYMVIFTVMGVSDFFIVSCTLWHFFVTKRRYRARKKIRKQLQLLEFQDPKLGGGAAGGDSKATWATTTAQPSSGTATAKSAHKSQKSLAPSATSTMTPVTPLVLSQSNAKMASAPKKPRPRDVVIGMEDDGLDNEGVDEAGVIQAVDIEHDESNFEIPEDDIEEISQEVITKAPDPKEFNGRAPEGPEDNFRVPEGSIEVISQEKQVQDIGEIEAAETDPLNPGADEWPETVPKEPHHTSAPSSNSQHVPLKADEPGRVDNFPSWGRATPLPEADSDADK